MSIGNFVSMFVYMYVCIYLYMCRCMCLCVDMYMCMNMAVSCMFICAHIPFVTVVYSAVGIPLVSNYAV